MVLGKKLQGAKELKQNCSTFQGSQSHSHICGFLGGHLQSVDIDSQIDCWLADVHEPFESMNNSDRSSAFSNVLTEPTQSAIYTGNIMCFLLLQV